MDKILTEDSFIICINQNDWVGQVIKEHGVWEIHIKDFLHVNLTKNDIFLDAGSNYGFHSLTAAKLCKKVYSFEPQDHIFKLQKESIEINKINNIELYKLGLGNVSTFLKLEPVDYNLNGVNMGNVGIDISPESEGELIEIKTIDDFGIGKIDYIKLDVQGYEKFVLDGATNTIKKYKPTLIVEVENHQLGKFNISTEQFYNYIRSLGYSIFTLDWEYPVDVICVHNDKLNSFLEKNNQYLSDLTEDYSVSNSLSGGVEKKLTYSTNTYHYSSRKKLIK